MEESQRKILRLVSKKNQAMAGTNRSDVQIRFGGQEGTPPPRRLPDPNRGQQGAHISRAGTWQCLRDLNKKSVNRAGPAPMARRLTFSVLFNPDAVQVNLSSLPTRPWQGVFAKWPWACAYSEEQPRMSDFPRRLERGQQITLVNRYRWHQWLYFAQLLLDYHSKQWL